MGYILIKRDSNAIFFARSRALPIHAVPCTKCKVQAARAAARTARRHRAGRTYGLILAGEGTQCVLGDREEIEITPADAMEEGLAADMLCVESATTSDFTPAHDTGGRGSRASGASPTVPPSQHSFEIRASIRSSMLARAMERAPPTGYLEDEGMCLFANECSRMLARGCAVCCVAKHCLHPPWANEVQDAWLSGLSGVRSITLRSLELATSLMVGHRHPAQPSAPWVVRHHALRLSPLQTCTSQLATFAFQCWLRMPRGADRSLQCTTAHRSSRDFVHDSAPVHPCVLREVDPLTDATACANLHVYFFLACVVRHAAFTQGARCSRS